MVRLVAVPDRGSIVWLNFSPQSGHEQAEHRPALVLSPKLYNQRSGFCIACPITSKQKGYPFEVPLQLQGVSGVVLADQVKSFDWEARVSKVEGYATEATINAVLNKIRQLLY